MAEVAISEQVPVFVGTGRCPVGDLAGHLGTVKEHNVRRVKLAGEDVMNYGDALAHRRRG